MLKEIKKLTLNDLASSLINNLTDSQDFFNAPIIVFPNFKMEQWFKFYWLKNTDKYYLNIDSMRFSSFVGSCFDKLYKTLNADSLRDYIIVFLTNKSSYSNEEKYILFEDGSINPIKLYDFASNLAKLFIKYDEDMVDINTISWQKPIYEGSIKIANDKGIYTQRQIIDSIKITNNSKSVHFFATAPLSKLKQYFVNKYASVNDNVYVYYQEETSLEDNIKVISATSMQREVECIHGKICKIINEEKDLSYSDFLILSMDINAYANTLKRVFEQDDINYPNIPVVITNSSLEATPLKRGLQTLVGIYKKGYVSRSDFADMINNQDVKLVRKLDDSDVHKILKAITDMNVFRNREGFNDWAYAKKRLLLSRLVGDERNIDNLVSLNEGDYLPFNSIDLDDELVAKFVSLIDDLESFTNLLKDKKYIDSELLDNLTNELSKWFSYQNDLEEKENPNFIDIKKTINRYLEENIENIPVETLLIALINDSMITKVTHGNIFSGGITCTNFDASSVLQAKYIFMLGMDSNHFPRTNTSSELDLNQVENDITSLDITGFKKLANNASILYASYINRDLKKDEEFYPSSVILNITPEYIGLDEKRSFNDLYTENEFKKRNNYTKLTSFDSFAFKHAKIGDVNSQDKPARIKLSDVASYLKEPLSFKAKTLFEKYNDDYDEQIKESFEPLETNPLQNSNLVKQILCENFDIEKIIKEQELSRLIGDNDYLKLAINEVKATCDEIIESIQIQYPSFDKKVTHLSDLVLENGGSEYTIECNINVFKVEDKGEFNYFALKKQDKADPLSLYVFALMDMAANNYTEEKQINLYGKNKETFKINSIEAKELLNQIYQNMYDYEENIFITCDDVADFNALREKATSSYGPWGYFDSKKMFDLEKDLGITRDDFEQYQNHQLIHKRLIKYLNVGGEE